MTALETIILHDGQALYDHIVAMMQNHAVFGGTCADPVYLLRYTDGYGIAQYAQDGEKCWTSVFTASCDTIQKLIGSPLVPHQFSRLWALKVNADFLFSSGDSFRDPNFAVKAAELVLRPPGWEVIFYGVIPPNYLYNEPFVVGQNCT